MLPGSGLTTLIPAGDGFDRLKKFGNASLTVSSNASAVVPREWRTLISTSGSESASPSGGDGSVNRY